MLKLDPWQSCTTSSVATAQHRHLNKLRCCQHQLSPSSSVCVESTLAGEGCKRQERWHIYISHVLQSLLRKKGKEMEGEIKQLAQSQPVSGKQETDARGPDSPPQLPHLTRVTALQHKSFRGILLNQQKKGNKIVLQTSAELR